MTSLGLQRSRRAPTLPLLRSMPSLHGLPAVCCMGTLRLRPAAGPGPLGRLHRPLLWTPGEPASTAGLVAIAFLLAGQSGLSRSSRHRRAPCYPPARCCRCMRCFKQLLGLSHTLRSRQPCLTLFPVAYDAFADAGGRARRRLQRGGLLRVHAPLSGGRRGWVPHCPPPVVGIQVLPGDHVHNCAFGCACARGGGGRWRRGCQGQGPLGARGRCRLGSRPSQA